jgi:hypothetical protein
VDSSRCVEEQDSSTRRIRGRAFHVRIQTFDFPTKLADGPSRTKPIDGDAYVHG